MGFPHCPICVALAFYTFCLVVTRSYMIFILYKGSLDSRDKTEYSYPEFNYLLNLDIDVK